MDSIKSIGNKFKIIILLIVQFLVVGTSYAEVSTGIVYPVTLSKITSNFGTRFHPVKHTIKHHNGVDLSAKAGSAIRSVAPGVVIFAGAVGGYGKLIVVQHDSSVTTHYGHCQKILAKVGERVLSGQVIALVGSTGISTGPHLHFELRVKGKPLNPEVLLSGLKDNALG